jgi:hypothetical protein
MSTSFMHTFHVVNGIRILRVLVNLRLFGCYSSSLLLNVWVVFDFAMDLNKISCFFSKASMASVLKKPTLTYRQTDEKVFFYVFLSGLFVGVFFRLSAHSALFLEPFLSSVFNFSCHQYSAWVYLFFRNPPCSSDVLDLLFGYYSKAQRRAYDSKSGVSSMSPWLYTIKLLLWFRFR